MQDSTFDLVERLAALGRSALADVQLHHDVYGYVRECLRKDALIHGKFILASGEESSYYFDLRRVTLASRCAAAVAYLLLRELKPDITAVGGPTLGADPLVSSMVAIAPFFQMEIAGFLVRKEPKKHGTAKMIEGPVKRGSRVAVVEDVVTTGGSLLRAVQAAEEAGLRVRQALVVLDRSGGQAEKLFSAQGLTFHALFTAEEILEEG